MKIQVTKFEMVASGILVANVKFLKMHIGVLYNPR